MSRVMPQLSGLGKSLFGKLGVGDFSKSSLRLDKNTPVTAGNINELSAQLKSGSDNINYSSNGVSFAVGKDPIPAQFSDDEFEKIALAVEDFASPQMRERFYNAQYKSDVGFAGVELPSTMKDNNRGKIIFENLAKKKLGFLGLLNLPTWYDVEVDGHKIDRSDVLADYGICIGPKNELKLDGKNVGYVGNGKMYVSLGEMNAVLERFGQIDDFAFKNMPKKIRARTDGVLEKLPAFEIDATDEDYIRKEISEKLQHAKVENKKRFRFFTREGIDSETYNSLFHVTLKNYDKKKIHGILQSLEKEIAKSDRYKMHLLKREFEIIEHVYRKRNLSFGLAALLTSAAAIGIYTVFNNNSNHNIIPTPTPNNSPTQNPTDLVKQNFINSMAQQNITTVDATNYFNQYREDIAAANGNYTRFVPQVKLNALSPTTYAELHRNVLSDPRVTIDRPTLLSHASQDIMNLGYNGKDKVLNPDGTYRTENLSKESVQFLGNLSMAEHQFNLALPSAQAVQLVTNMSQNNPNVINYEPIKVSGDFNITAVPSRAAWDTVQQVKAINDSGFDIVKHPEMGLAISTKVIANEWSTFDNPYGIKYHDPTVTVGDPRYSDLTSTQSKIYLQFAPIDGGNKTFNEMKSWDSDVAKAKNPDLDKLRTYLFNSFELQPVTKDTGDGKMLTGIEGAKTSLLQAADLLHAIVGLYPDGKMEYGDMSRGGILLNPRILYYDFLDDRLHHGLNNTITDFVGGWDDSKVNHGQGWEKINYDWVKNQNGPLQFVEKIYPSYKLAESIIGYVRGSSMPIDEQGKIDYIMPAVLRTLGFSVNHINIEPTPSGASNREVAVGLQQVDAQSLQQNFKSENIVFGPGDTFCPYSMGTGLTTNGITMTYSLYGDKPITAKK